VISAEQEVYRKSIFGLDSQAPEAVAAAEILPEAGVLQRVVDVKRSSEAEREAISLVDFILDRQGVQVDGAHGGSRDSDRNRSGQAEAGGKSAFADLSDSHAADSEKADEEESSGECVFHRVFIVYRQSVTRDATI